MADVAYLIPTPSSDTPFLRSRVVLSGVVYILEYLWSTRREVWELSVLDSAGNGIVRCVTMVPDYDLLFGVVRDGRPPGSLILVTGSGDYPTLTSLETDRLYYVVDEEEDA